MESENVVLLDKLINEVNDHNKRCENILSRNMQKRNQEKFLLINKFFVGIFVASRHIYKF